MSPKRDISHEDFVSACCTVATILAGGWWNQVRTTGRVIKRPAQAPSAAMDLQRAAKYCSFGRTKFRQLVVEGVFPQPVTIEGLKRWLAKDLDAALIRLEKTQQKRE